MPHLYYFELCQYEYMKYFSQARYDNPELFSKINHHLHNPHSYTEDYNNISLHDFLDAVANIHLHNIEILSKYNLHTKYLPSKESTANIFKIMKNKIKENDIVSIYSYRGCGQYYVYNDNDSLKVNLHSGEYGREYPPEATDYFLKNKIYKYMVNNNMSHHYTGYNVFYEMHRKNMSKINVDEYEGCTYGILVCGSGLYIDLELYDVLASRTPYLKKNPRYLIVKFDYETDDDIDHITIINKATKDMYAVKCFCYGANSLI